MATCKESGKKWGNSLLHSSISCGWSSGAGMLLVSFGQPPARMCFDCCWAICCMLVSPCLPGHQFQLAVSFHFVIPGDLSGWSLSLYPKSLSAVQTYCLHLCWTWFCFFSSFNMWNNSKIHLIVSGRQRSLVLLWHWMEGGGHFAACFPFGLVASVPLGRSCQYGWGLCGTGGFAVWAQEEGAATWAVVGAYLSRGWQKQVTCCLKHLHWGAVAQQSAGSSQSPEPQQGWLADACVAGLARCLSPSASALVASHQCSRNW